MVTYLLISAGFLSIVCVLLFKLRSQNAKSKYLCTRSTFMGVVRIIGIVLASIITGILLFPAASAYLRDANWRGFASCGAVCLVCSVSTGFGFYYFSHWLVSKVSVSRT